MKTGSIKGIPSSYESRRPLKVLHIPSPDPIVHRDHLTGWEEIMNPSPPYTVDSLESWFHALLPTT